METMIAEIIKCCSNHVIPYILSGEENFDFVYGQCLELYHDQARQEHHTFLLKFSQTFLNYKVKLVNAKRYALYYKRK